MRCRQARPRARTGEIKANDFVTNGGPEIVTISPDDVGFKSDGCVQWSDDLRPLKDPNSSIPTGMWQVGKEVAPRTYSASPDANGHCYWERESGFGGTLGEIKANGFTNASSIVTIDASDIGFKSDGCTDWTPT